MAQGSKEKYTDKQKRKAQHIEEGYEARGVGKKEAQSRAWATVNREDGGGKLSGSGRKKKVKPAKKAVKKTAKKKTAKKTKKKKQSRKKT